MSYRTYLNAFTAFTIALIASQNSNAEEYFEGVPLDLSANAALTSNYLFRGISQSDEKPALQLGLNATYPITDSVDFYAGAWGSNINFNDSHEGKQEIDYLSGIAFEVGDFAVDLGTIYYSYPTARGSLNYDFFEYMASVGYDYHGLYATYSLNYSANNFGDSGDAYYNKLALEYPLTPTFTLNSYVGNQTVEKNVTFTVADYLDYGFGATYSIEDFADVSLNFVSTNLSEADCGDNCGNTMVLTVAKSF